MPGTDDGVHTSPFRLRWLARSNIFAPIGLSPAKKFVAELEPCPKQKQRVPAVVNGMVLIDYVGVTLYA